MTLHGFTRPPYFVSNSLQICAQPCAVVIYSVLMLYLNQPSAPDICLKESSQWTSDHKSYVLNFCSGHFFIQNRMLSKGGSKGKTGCSQLSGGAKTRGEFSKHLASLVCNTISQSCSTSKSSSYYLAMSADEDKWFVFNHQNPAYCSM